LCRIFLITALASAGKEIPANTGYAGFRKVIEPN
jgi:hypothetical protein